MCSSVSSVKASSCLNMITHSLLKWTFLLLATIPLAAGAWNQGGGTSWNAGGGGGGGGGQWSPAPGPGAPGPVPGPATPAPPQNTAQPVPSVVPGDGCAFAGQFLPVPGSQCVYYVCVVGGPSDPWADGSNRYTLARQQVPCAPGSGVPAGYTGGNANPCEARPGACVPPKPAPGTGTGGVGGGTGGGSGGTGGGGKGGGAGPWSWATPAPAQSWQQAPRRQYVVQISPHRAARSPVNNGAQQRLLQAWGNMQSSMKQLFSQMGKKK